MSSLQKQARFIHVGLSVSDIDRSIAWYEHHFGCRVTKRFEKPELEIKGVVLQFDTVIFEILQPYKSCKTQEPTGSLIEELRYLGANHIAIGVGDVAKCYETFKDAGCEMVTQLIGGKLFFCKDPDGTLIEVKQN
ncbi:MAG: hypothetical protein GF401_10380 [Chitinivibrionales bacterium]|nr:hypothetical protein [Chitinivibrionales bacterium]